MKPKHDFSYKIAATFIPILSIILFITRGFFIKLAESFPPCLFYSTFHLYCPACGNTRSVTALLHGDILASLRYNITPLLLCVFILLDYIEVVSISIHRHVLLLPRKLRFYLILITLLMIYMLLRNFIPYLTP